MIKEAKFYRKQAEKAERMARSTSEADTVQGFQALARAYRSQAKVLKRSRRNKRKQSNPAG